MTQYRGWAFVAALAIVWLCASPAAAQPSDTGWTLSLMGGRLCGGDLMTGREELTMIGAVGLGVGGGVSLEAEVAAVPELRQFGDLDLWLGTASIRYHPVSVGRITPYGLLGGSLVRISDHGAGRREAELALDMGGGMWLRITSRVAFRADIRFIHIDNAPNFWRAAAGVTFAP